MFSSTVFFHLSHKWPILDVFPYPYLIFHILFPPRLPLHNLPLPSRNLSSKNNRMTPHNLLKRTPQKRPLGIPNTHPLMLNSTDSLKKVLDKPIVSTPMPAPSARRGMDLVRPCAEIVDVDRAAVVADFACGAVNVAAPLALLFGVCDHVKGRRLGVVTILQGCFVLVVVPGHSHVLVVAYVVVALPDAPPVPRPLRYLAVGRRRIVVLC